MDPAAAAASQKQQTDPVLRFDPDFQQHLDGEAKAGGRLRIDYAPDRVACRRERLGVPIWSLETYIQFDPAGERYSAEGVSFSVPVPLDATSVEVWFRSSNLMGCSVWDSRYGQNYRFPVTGPANPVDNVGYRAGAITDPSMVNTFRQLSSKVLRFFTDNPSDGRELDTRLAVEVWVRNLAFEKRVWIDVHVFDDSSSVALAATFPIPYEGPGGGGGDVFKFDAKIYQGSGGGPGSAWDHSDARNVQYRLYYEVNGQLFTDGILHEDEVQPDDVVWNAG
jgi:hypothetical protein